MASMIENIPPVSTEALYADALVTNLAEEALEVAGCCKEVGRLLATISRDHVIK